MFLLDRMSSVKLGVCGLTMKGDSALSCRPSNPVAIPDKFRAELDLSSGFEGVHRNSHPVVTVHQTRRSWSPLKKCWAGQHTGHPIPRCKPALTCWVQWGNEKWKTWDHYPWVEVQCHSPITDSRRHWAPPELKHGPCSRITKAKMQLTWLTQDTLKRS